MDTDDITAHSWFASIITTDSVVTYGTHFMTYDNMSELQARQLMAATVHWTLPRSDLSYLTGHEIVGSYNILDTVVEIRPREWVMKW